MSEQREKMKDKSAQRRWALRTFIALTLFSAAVVAGTAPQPDIPKAAKGEQCVEDTDFMRRNHMNLLMHQRDDTLRLGVRTQKHSLKNCFTCHVVKDEQNQPVTVADPRHFCRECHDYAAVKVDCFQCHVSTPSSGNVGSL
jgi:hypothetical protein